MGTGDHVTLTDIFKFLCTCTRKGCGLVFNRLPPIVNHVMCFSLWPTDGPQSCLG